MNDARVTPGASAAAGSASAPGSPSASLQRILRARGHSFAWGPGTVPLLMAIVNATPDSFSDGGLHADAASAIDFGERCIADGAAIVDIGGESTRPGAQRVDAAEQIARTCPVVEALARRAPVSIDTTRAAVAQSALAAGACMVNDVSAATDDPAIIDTACSAGAALVLMHRLHAPAEDRVSTEADPRRRYGDVVRDVRDWLGARIEAAARAGLPRECIAVDPGLGFGKDVAQNMELLVRVGEFASLGVPVLVGASRKSFLGAVAGEPDAARRDAASIVAALEAASNGAAILRVHDVHGHRVALAAWAAVQAAKSR
jgi:dihydropteroate synthase